MVFLGNIESILINLIVKNFVETKKKNKIKKIYRNKNTQKSKFSISTILINSEIKNENKEKESEEDLEETTEDGSEDKKKIIVKLYLSFRFSKNDRLFSNNHTISFAHFSGINN